MTRRLPELPPSLASALRPVLPELASEIIAAIGREVPDYARPMEGAFGRAIRGGTERALTRFVDSVADPSAVDDRAREIYVLLGRGEMRAGRRLDALLSAYRVGARVAWERFVAAGEAAGHEPPTLYRLGLAIFTYIDAISAESIEGYADEQSAAAGERQRRREALVRLLARDDVTETEVRDVAVLAAWGFPSKLAALVIADPDSARLASRLGADAIAAHEGEVTLAFVPDPDAPGRRAQLAAALGRIPAALGPTVPPMRGHYSVVRARAAHRLIAEGVLPAGEPVVADEHLASLILHGADRTLAADFAARELAPLDDLTAAARARLTDTLRAWLDHPGQVQRVAELLHVHPQTVRYRIGQLRELFGDALEDAERRFELGLALRAANPLGDR
jgi:PucR-like helix-turn-helix protein